jgi:VanZ family protein
MTHRAITLAVMIVLSMLMLGVMLASGIASMGGQGWIALAVVVVAAAVAGVLFSWRRYFPRRR